jgi:PadR family transcriptional regulator, regulatory protein PadR
MGDAQKTGGDVIPGTLDMLILKTVSRGDAMHGYAIAQSIRDVSEDVLRLQEGALYPALHRLEVRGLLRSSWSVSENNRRAKYYAITAQGRRVLAQEQASWARMSAAIARIMQTA